MLLSDRRRGEGARGDAKLTYSAPIVERSSRVSTVPPNSSLNSKRYFERPGLTGVITFQGDTCPLSSGL